MVIRRRPMSASKFWISMSNSPGSERTACQEGMSSESRNHSRVASALPHSEGIAISRYAAKSQCACEWGGWGRLSDNGPGQITRTRARARGAVDDPPTWRCIIESSLPTQSGNIAVITRGTKGECKPADMQRMSGADLS